MIAAHHQLHAHTCYSLSDRSTLVCNTVRQDVVPLETHLTTLAVLYVVL